MNKRADITYTQEEAKRFKYEAERLAQENLLMREEIRLLRARRFGASSEKSVANGQGLLFNEAEYAYTPEPIETTSGQTTQRRTRPKGKREADLSGLPVDRIDYELPLDERICPCCGGELHEMDIDIRRELEYIPASVRVIEHATHIYACRACQTDAERTPIKAAPSPKALFPGSLVTPSLLSQVIADKYLYHLPLYRQQAAFAADGISLSRQTLANWVIRASEDWLGVLYLRMKDLLVTHEVIHADETTLEVLREPGRKASQKSYMWLYRTGGDTSHPLVLYEYKTSRSHEHPRAFLKDFTGYCHADGYAGYHKLPDRIRIVGCWAHARRKFDEALKALPEKDKAGSLASHALDLINRLFELERSFQGLSFDERHEVRLEKSRPLAEELFEWAKNSGPTPKSLVGRAVHYLKEQHDYLMRVFEDGRLELSNNRAERSIKPFVIGRKNWMFSNTPRGAEASAIIFSIIETAKENRLNVYEYLKYLFERLSQITSTQIDDCLPWSESIPDHIKVPTAY